MASGNSAAGLRRARARRPSHRAGERRKSFTVTRQIWARGTRIAIWRSVTPPKSASFTALVFAFAALLFACHSSPTAPEKAAQVSAKVAQVAAAVTGQDAPIADEA